MRGSCPQQTHFDQTLSYDQLIYPASTHYEQVHNAYPPDFHLLQSATGRAQGSSCRVRLDAAVHLTDGGVRDVDQNDLKVLVG